MSRNIRREIDRLDDVVVPTDTICRARTPRLLEHFSISKDLVPRELIVAYGTLRKAAADADDVDKQLDDRAPQLVIVTSRMDSFTRSPIEPRETVLRVGSLELDLVDRAARRGNRPIDLRPREFQLLKYMMQRSDQLLTRADLLKDVWHYKFVPETNLVDVHMGRLRRKIHGPNDHPMIRNVRGRGFILSAGPALSTGLFGTADV